MVFGCDNIYGFSLQGGELTVKPNRRQSSARCYRRFLMDGKGTYIIARELTAEGIPPPSGKGKSWSSTMVLRLLRGEKYCGDLLQRKSCTPDFLDHRKVKNEGQSPQVYLRDHHEAIVPRSMFEAVRRELDRRQANRKAGSRPSARYWCSGKVVCGRCGSRFVPRRGAQADGGSAMGVRETGAARRGSVCGSGSWESDFAEMHEANCTGFTNQHRGGIAADLAHDT